MNNDVLDPPAAYGVPLFSAVLKAEPEDFRVLEELDIAFNGEGEHLYLQIEKTSMNTDEVVEVLQRCFNLASADVGFCGLKDRHSVSTQWFSVRTPADPMRLQQPLAEFNEQQQAQWGESGGYIKSIRLLRSERHSRKLKRGAHQCNRFNIRLKQVQGLNSEAVVLQEALEKRIEQLRLRGFPNYIGAQRFGHGGQNLQRARQWFGKPRKRTSRQQRSLWLSAARSALFNQVCAARVTAGSWDQLLEGEPAVLDGSRSFFIPQVSDDLMTLEHETTDLERRLRDFDIHPSAPWWGRGRSLATSACAEFEARHVQSYVDICAGLERAGLTQERRAIRAIATDLDMTWLDNDGVELSFALMPGVFATTLLREFCQTSG